MASFKLLIRIRCSTCKGTRIYSAGGHYDPMKPKKWGICPYCDPEGMEFIEASTNTIVEYLFSLAEEQRNSILQQLNERLLDFED